MIEYSKEFVRMRQPYGIYSTHNCTLVHIGLYESISQCWQIWLGWPTEEEIQDAKLNGYHCIPVTCHYKLPDEQSSSGKEAAT
jgi:hypothetical protein